MFWTVHPKENACEKCKALEGIKFDKKPERPHPNCKCEIKKHECKLGKQHLLGFLEGFEDSASHLFYGLGHVNVTVTHYYGALASGVHVYSNLDGVRQSHTATKSVSFDFGTLTETPVLWSIQIVQTGADNTKVEYVIEYETYE